MHTALLTSENSSRHGKSGLDTVHGRETHFVARRHRQLADLGRARGFLRGGPGRNREAGLEEAPVRGGSRPVGFPLVADLDGAAGIQAASLPPPISTFLTTSVPPGRKRPSLGYEPGRASAHRLLAPAGRHRRGELRSVDQPDSSDSAAASARSIDFMAFSRKRHMSFSYTFMSKLVFLRNSSSFTPFGPA